MPPSPYQGRESDISGLHGSTAKCLRTLVGNHAHTRLTYKQINTRTHHTNKIRAIHQHAQTRLPWYLWIAFPTILFGMLPRPCNGARANSNPQFRHITRTLPDMLSTLPLTLPTFRSTSLDFTTQSYCFIHIPPQRSRRNPKRSSAALLTRVSNCPWKAIAPTVHMGRSGSGTSRAWPT